MDFVLFLLVNAMLFIRPAEIVPELLGLPLYEACILACLVVSLPKVVRQLGWGSLKDQPITLCVVGLLPAILLSGLPRFYISGSIGAVTEFAKIVIYYLLLVATVNSPGRLRVFLIWLTGLIVVLTAIAVLQYHGVVDIPALTVLQQSSVDRDTGELIYVPRMRSTGIYHDPNDLSLILGGGMMLCLCCAGDRAFRLARFAWLAPLAFLGYALILTKSRGGFLAFVAGLLVLCHARFGWRKTLGVAAVGLPLLVFLFAGRQTNIDLADKEDSFQTRVELWSDGLQLLRQNPVFGIGYEQYADQAGQVAHNSYVHSYTELGLGGGTLFLGAFFLAVLGLRRHGSSAEAQAGGRLWRLRPYLLALVIAYAVGLWSLSRCYVAPTYTVLGLATAYVKLPSVGSGEAVLRLNVPLLKRVALASGIGLVGIYLFVRLLVQHT